MIIVIIANAYIMCLTVYKNHQHYYSMDSAIGIQYIQTGLRKNMNSITCVDQIKSITISYYRHKSTVIICANGLGYISVVNGAAADGSCLHLVAPSQIYKGSTFCVPHN